MKGFIMSDVKVYENDDIVIEWRRDKCQHAAKCVKGLPKVFNLKARPWINVNGADADTVAGIIDTCPSGALSYKRK